MKRSVRASFSLHLFLYTACSSKEDKIRGLIDDLSRNPPKLILVKDPSLATLRKIGVLNRIDENYERLEWRGEATVYIRKAILGTPPRASAGTANQQ